MKTVNIFFDFDGVIIESNQIKAHAFYELYKPYGKSIANTVLDNYTAEGGISRQKKFHKYHKKLLDQELTNKQVSALSERFSKIVFKKIIDAPFIKGIKIFLKENYKQMHFSIISGTPHTELKKICQALEIEQYFIEICGSPKNKVCWIDELTNTYNLNKSETILIGDSKVDFDSAKTAKINFILREHQLNKQIFSNYTGPRIKDFSDIKIVLENI